ncbi:hypothetical protein BDC45DRAFT_570971 [Circinella umbellata]|nr:hypothetical protein BDC45DRAFT_570971 [Circinella umbellata]
MNSNNQNNNFEDWLFLESNIQDSYPITDNSIDIDVILNNFNTAVPQIDTDPTQPQKQTTDIETEITTKSDFNHRSEETLSRLEDYRQLMTGLKLSPYTQLSIKDLIYSKNLSRFIEGKFTKGMKQILEANEVLSEELLNPKNQFRRKLAQELKRKLK